MFDGFDTYASLVTKLKKINKGVERKTFFNVAGIGGGTSSTKDEFAMDVDHLKIAITDVDSKMSDSPCYKCGRKGHWAADCFAKTKAGQGGFKSQGDMWAANSYTSGKKRFGNKGGRGGNFRGNKGRGRGGFRGKGKGRAIRALDEDYDEDEEEEDDEDAQQEETDMGMSIRAAI
jgi:hypothetical protein